jgi:regulator of sirC expression with transglutaminase-like and TPR domain
VLISMTEYARAVENFSHAIELNPTDAELYRMRAHARGQLNDHAGAAADFTSALELSPGSTNARSQPAQIKDRQASAAPKGHARAEAPRPNETSFERFQRTLRD